MKTHRYFASTLARLLAGLTVGCVIPVPGQTETPLPSTVVRLKGHARCKTAGGATWSMIKVGELIYPGSVIETAQRSDMDLLLGEEVKPARRDADSYNPEVHPGNVVRLSEDSVLQIDKLARKPAAGSKESEEEIQLELRSGTMLGSVRKLAGESKYEIAFASGVAGTRGAVYGLSAKGELSVLKGAAYIALADGSPARAVGADQQFNPSTGLITNLARLSAPLPKNLRTPSEPDRERPATFTPVSPPRRAF